MKPWIFKGIVGGMIVLACIMVAFVFLVFARMNASSAKGLPPLSFVAASKETVKQTLRAVKRKVYYEATIHNPDGDTIPDAWDDEFLGFLKKVF